MAENKRFYEVKEKVWIKELEKPGIVEELNVPDKSAIVSFFVDKQGTKERKEFKFWEINKFEPAIKVNIKYFGDAKQLEKISIGDWIDVYANEDCNFKQFENKLIPLGFAMEIPKGYEGWLISRSSTFKNFGIIQANAPGIIDHSYCGDNDQWFFNAIALRDTEIKKGSKIAQFRLMENMPKVKFNEVDVLGNEDRGGHGTTGTE